MLRFCIASEAKRHIMRTLSVIRLSRLAFAGITCVLQNPGSTVYKRIELCCHHEHICFRYTSYLFYVQWANEILQHTVKVLHGKNCEHIDIPV